MIMRKTRNENVDLLRRKKIFLTFPSVSWKVANVFRNVLCVNFLYGENKTRRSLGTRSINDAALLFNLRQIGSKIFLFPRRTCLNKYINTMCFDRLCGNFPRFITSAEMEKYDWVFTGFKNRPGLGVQHFVKTLKRDSLFGFFPFLHRNRFKETLITNNTLQSLS